MYNDDFLEQYANESLTDARQFMERERLTRHGSVLEVGHLPTWLIVGLVIVFVGMLILAL
jgi:hypothetical protein